MKITIKSIAQDVFELDLAPELTIAEVKTHIAEKYGAEKFPVDGQKLIYNGKVLSDESTLASHKIDESRFIVLIVKRPKPEAPAPAVPATPVKEEAGKSSTDAAGASTPVGKEPPVQTPQAPKKESSAEPAAAAAPPVAAPADDTIPAEHEDSVNTLIAMGYPRSDAIAALRAAFFDVSRAVEYLLSGIPDNVIAGLVEEGAAAAGGAGNGHNDLEFLSNNEQFAELRQMVRENPAILPELLQQISEENPQLMDLIRENEEAFLLALNAEDEAGEGDNAGVQVGGPGGIGPVPPGVHIIELTQAEQDAVGRLQAMGFPRQMVIEAYLACDRNEDLAVNYILNRIENGGASDDEMEQ